MTRWAGVVIESPREEVNAPPRGAAIKNDGAVVLPFNDHVPTGGYSAAVAAHGVPDYAGYIGSAYVELDDTLAFAWPEGLGASSITRDADASATMFRLPSDARFLAVNEDWIAYKPLSVGDVGSFAQAVRPVNVDPISEHRRAVVQAELSLRSVLAQFRKDVDSAASARAKQAPHDVVGSLTEDLGIGQLLVARAVGVTPTAVRKWRRGEAARPEHRARLSQFAGLCDVIAGFDVHDPAGWLEVAISAEATLTPFDLWMAGRGDLVLALAQHLVDPHEALDDFDSAWRTAYPLDAEYEVVTLADGSRSAVARR